MPFIFDAFNKLPLDAALGQVSKGAVGGCMVFMLNTHAVCSMYSQMGAVLRS